MDQTQLLTHAQQWANDILVWIGFGTVVGLLAKAIMPGKDPGGTIVTILLGIGGVIIGCGTFTLFGQDQVVKPISPLGLAVATAGAFTILCFHRLLGGHWQIDRRTAQLLQVKPAPRSRQRVKSLIFTE